MATEISISLTTKSSHETGYTATVSTPAGSYDVEAPDAFAAIIREDMRNLRWKAIGLRDPGDSMLIEAGTRIGNLLFPEERKAIWSCLDPNQPKQILVKFASGVEELFQVPWELVAANGEFLLAKKGSHLVREWGEPAHGAGDRQPVKILYVSFASDASLDFQKEREAIDATIPMSETVVYLANPSREALAATVNRLKPSVIHIASHGTYDFITGNHTVDVGTGEYVLLQVLIETISENIPEVLLLGICESARLSSDIGFNLPHAKNPANIIGYTYPVQDATAIESTRVFYKGLVEGKTLLEVMADVRGLSLADPFTFFNVVHYRLKGAADQPHVIVPKHVEVPRPPGPLLIGREAELGAITETLRTHDQTTVLAPRGFGGSTLVKAWCWINGRSKARAIQVIREADAERLRDAVRAHSANPGKKEELVVVDDPEGTLTIADVKGRKVLRSVEIAAYKSIEGEDTILLNELDADAAQRLISLVAPNGIAPLSNRDLGLVPAVIYKMANHPGQDLASIQTWFDAENKMSERFASLSEEGRRVGSLLAAVGGFSQLTTEGDHVEKAYGMSVGFLSRGIASALKANVIVKVYGGYRLAPDFHLLKAKWFPNFAQENESVLKDMFRVAMTLITHSPVEERDAEFASRVLRMAVAMSASAYAIELFAVLIPWYSNRGNLEELLGIAIALSDQTQGMEAVVARGTIAKIVTEQSFFKEALKMHRDLEIRLESLKGEQWYEQNLIASLTGQVDCLTNLGMPEDAFQKLTQAIDVTKAWKNPLPDVEPRLLAQLGELYLYRGNIKEARGCLAEAVLLAEKAASASLLAEVLYTQAQILWQLDQDDEATKILDRISRVVEIKHIDRLYPQVLDLRAKLMAKRKDPRAIDFLLESYERDLLHSDYRGAAISLLSLVKLFVELAEFDQAEARLKDLEKLVNDHGIETERGGVQYYRGMIYLERGDKAAARKHFLLAEKLDLESGQLRHAAQARAWAEDCE